MSTLGTQPLRGRPSGGGGILGARLSDLVLGVVVLALMTVSYSFSTLTVAGVPVASALVALVGITYVRDIGLALRASALLRFLFILWLAWCGVTVARLVVDTPVYGELAMRDALITFAFGAIFIGGGMVIRYGEDALLRLVRPFTIVLLIWVLIGAADRVIPGLNTGLTFLNTGVASLALIGAGLWGTGFFYKAPMLAVGGLALVVGQSRMNYLLVIVLVVTYLLAGKSGSRRRRQTLTDRILLIVLMAVATVIVVSVLGTLPITGRVGGISFDMIGSLVQSVFDDSSALSGSRQDRERWWSGIFVSLQQAPHRYLTGLGLGPDLADGFHARDGSLVRKPHNDYLEALGRTGLVGIVALVTFALVAVVSAYRAMRRRDEYGAILGWIVAAVGSAYAQPYFSYPHGSIPFAILVGVVVVGNTVLRGGTPSGLTRSASSAEASS